jgi:thiamine biosynthesis protein ThiI
MDKQEIVTQAIALGTYEVSIVPDQDCCTLFIPRNPAVRTDHEEIERLEARLDMARLIRQGIEDAQVIDFLQENGQIHSSPGELKMAASEADLS